LRGTDTSVGKLARDKIPDIVEVLVTVVGEHDATLNSITGESQDQAVATAVNERLARLRRDDLRGRLLATGHKTASRISPETKWLGHAALPYDERGLG
jgi:antitoxin VapB